MTKYWFYDLVKFTLGVVFRVGFGLEVRGQAHVPRRGAFLLASNHMSHLDPPIVGVACPRRLTFMARTSLFDHALLGAFLRGVGALPLRRQERDLAAMREAVARLRQGEAIAMFPEGSRQRSGTLGRPRRGVALLAEHAAVPIIPVVVQGTFEALPPGARRLRREKIRVAFGPPISYTQGSHSAREAQGRLDAGGAETPPASWHHRHEEMAQSLARAWEQLIRQLEVKKTPHA